MDLDLRQLSIHWYWSEWRELFLASTSCGVEETLELETFFFEFLPPHLYLLWVGKFSFSITSVTPHLTIWFFIQTLPNNINFGFSNFFQLLLYDVTLSNHHLRLLYYWAEILKYYGVNILYENIWIVNWRPVIKGHSAINRFMSMGS